VQAVEVAIREGSISSLQFLFDEIQGLKVKGINICGIIEIAPVPLVELLLLAGANVDSRDAKTGKRLLHMAVATGNEHLIDVLLERGANGYICELNGNNVLHIAARLDPRFGIPLCCKLGEKFPELMKKVNRDAQTPIQYAKLSKIKDALQKCMNQAKRRSIGAQSKSSAATSAKKMSRDVETSNAQSLQGMSNSKSNASSIKSELLPRMRCSEVIKQTIENAIKKVADLHRNEKSQNKKHKPCDPESSRVDVPLKSKIEGDTQQPGVLHNSNEIAKKALNDLEWEFEITKEAYREWAAMDRVQSQAVLRTLEQIGKGLWLVTEGIRKMEASTQSLDLWSASFGVSGCIVFELCIDTSHINSIWTDMLRIWTITLQRESVEESLNQIVASHLRSQQVLLKLSLQPLNPGMSNVKHDGKHVPVQYAESVHSTRIEVGQPSKQSKSSLQSQASSQVVSTEYYPPASSSADVYTLLKFYAVDESLVRCALDGLDDKKVEFPFKTSQFESSIIKLEPDPPAPIILVGRSGTGKTTCIVYRMWANWLRFSKNQDGSFHQVFVTASATLKEQVSRTFRKLQAAVLSEKDLQELTKLVQSDYHVLRDIPENVFPLFLTTRQYLRMLDGTLSKPFFPRRDNGAVALEDEDEQDPDGVDWEVDLDDDDDFDDDDDDSNEEGDTGQESGPHGGKRNAPDKSGRTRPASSPRRKLMSYQYFADVLWKKLTSKQERASLKPSLVFQEIMSYIKGSSEALESEKGHLKLDQYLEVGYKRAPNYTAELRRQVYAVYERYEATKVRRWRYDNLDLVGHIYRSLADEGYRGICVHGIFRDEVQDFTQAELLLDLRTCYDPNGMFYSGDTCQTIARGIGFRFVDIGTLFFSEGQKMYQFTEEPAAIRMPLLKNLLVNYRTHSGILNVAASIVDVIKRFFPQYMDSLEREKAFFSGPKPLLLNGIQNEDLTILVSGSDKATSNVEFGAHQVILVRNITSIDSLPEPIRNSGAIIMTVSQSKGLEFDDVFLVDFFHDSPATREWHVVLQFLWESLEHRKKCGADMTPEQQRFLEMEINRSKKGHLRMEQFDDRKHVLLCEELKHLYTAVTRAKNNLIIFDKNEAKREPMFHYLETLGLAHVVRNLLKDGLDAPTYSLSQTRSSPEEWAKRGYNLYMNSLHELATQCFERACDPVWALVADAHAKIQRARSSHKAAEARHRLREAAEDFLVAATESEKAKLPVTNGLALRWVHNAIHVFAQAGDLCTAIELLKKLQKFSKAREICLRAGRFDLAAECCEELAEIQPKSADDWLKQACHYFARAKMYMQCINLFKKHKSVHFEDMEEIASRALRAAYRRGHTESIVECCPFVDKKDLVVFLSDMKLWEILARFHPDPVKGAELFAACGKFEEAAEKLYGLHGNNTELCERLHNYLLMVESKESCLKARELWKCGNADSARLRGDAMLGALKVGIEEGQGMDNILQTAQGALSEYMKAEIPLGALEVLAALESAMNNLPHQTMQDMEWLLEHLEAIVRFGKNANKILLALKSWGRGNFEQQKWLNMHARHYGIITSRRDRQFLDYRSYSPRMLRALMQFTRMNPGVQGTHMEQDIDGNEEKGLESQPSTYRKVENSHCKRATGTDIFWIGWKGLRMLMEVLVRKLVQCALCGGQTIRDSSTKAMKHLELVVLACKLHCTLRSQLRIVEDLIPQADINTMWRIMTPIRRQLVFLITAGVFPTCGLENEADLRQEMQDLCRRLGFEKMDQIVRDGLWVYQGMRLKDCIQDSNTSYWFWRFAFTFRTPQHRDEDSYLSQSFNDVARRARTSLPRHWICCRMYRDYRRLFCINGNLLHTAGKRAKNRIKEAVDDLLLFLRRSRTAENASPGNPKLALQCHLEILELAAGMVLLGLADKAYMPSYVSNALKVPELQMKDAV